MSFSSQQVCILSTYQGAVWAGKILADWGCKVIYQNPTLNTAIIIGDDSNLILLQPFYNSRIILTDVQVDYAHVLALSGQLVTFGQNKNFFFPKHLVETVVSNSLAIKVLQNLYEIFQKNRDPKTVEYISIVSLVKYFGAFNISAKQNGFMNFQRGQNLLDGGAPFYSVYQCKTGFIAIGNLQPKFYKEMIRGLNLPNEVDKFCQNSQFIVTEWPKIRQVLTNKFSQKSSRQWQSYFRSYDTCITQIQQPTIDKGREPKIVAKL